jgi:SAM-dependent methyltransferase
MVNTMSRRTGSYNALHSCPTTENSSIDTKAVYSSKAEKYARYRWNYAPPAIQAVFDIACITRASSVADIGAGTGILTRAFAGQAGRAWAVEPNPEMRRLAERALQPHAACRVIDGSAEATTLPDHSVDVITVAQAIHWFDPEPTRAEFLRILKPGGWLAVLRNYGADEKLGKATEGLLAPENGVDFSHVARLPDKKSVSFYYGHEAFQTMTFPFSYRQNWEEFIGSLLTASYVPDEDHPLYKAFESAARRVFEDFSTDGWLEARGDTEVCIGQPTTA